ncbi:MAG: hypothetical protein FD180_1493 [Planctomycetota bacterium]|nr:MAG: hypothetical protein FD180_1493 [Planctomycetota bacterium]
MPRALAAFALLVVCASISAARDPEWGGLGAVAASPDGKTVVCGGENRVLYVLDAATREVKQRIWIQARVGALAFSKDGTRLCLEDDDEVLHFFDTSTWKEVQKVADAGDCAFAPTADLCLAISGKENGIRFLSMTDGVEKGKTAIKGRIGSAGIDAAGTKAVVVMEPEEDKAEPKADYSAIPKELKGAARKEWIQKNDALSASVKWFEAPTGKPLAEAKTFFTARGRVGVMSAGEYAWIMPYDDVCARITPKGEVTIFEVTTSYNYGRGWSADGKLAIGGGLRSGAICTLDGGTAVKFEVDRLPGWPEYWAGFTTAADGGFWGVTSACRLVKIAKDGKVESAGPVY